MCLLNCNSAIRVRACAQNALRCIRGIFKLIFAQCARVQRYALSRLLFVLHMRKNSAIYPTVLIHLNIVMCMHNCFPCKVQPVTLQAEQRCKISKPFQLLPARKIARSSGTIKTSQDLVILAHSCADLHVYSAWVPS